MNKTLSAWPGWSARKTLVLPIRPREWPPPRGALELDALRLRPKRELHVTLIGTTLAQALRDAGWVRTRAIRDAFTALDWRYVRTGVLLLLCQPAGGGHARAHSLIERIELPAMADFHKALAGLLQRRLPVPPPHVTLYTAGRHSGIGLPDERSLQRYRVRTVGHEELAQPRAASDRSASLTK
jgi:hypothetical protein